MSDSISLDAIGLRHGTDKSSIHHDYLNFYETFLYSLRSQPIKILEVGVLNGASLATWEDYFPEAQIVGADINPATKRFQRERITIELLDQSNIEELTRVAIKHGPFDVIVEDGSHIWDHQITTLRTLFPFVTANGLYVVEDLQTNYGNMVQDYRGNAVISCVEFLKKWLDLRVGDDQIPLKDVKDDFLRTYGRAVHSLTFYRRACLIRKQYLAPERGLLAGNAVSAQSGTIAVHLLAHVSNMGDVFGEGGFVNASKHFQGFEIKTDDAALEYRVMSDDGSWSDWVPGGKFAGTRGMSRLLRGFCIRLRPESSAAIRLTAFAKFSGSEEVVEALDGQDCCSKDGAPLTGLQVVLTAL